MLLCKFCIEFEKLLKKKKSFKMNLIVLSLLKSLIPFFKLQKLTIFKLQKDEIKKTLIYKKKLKWGKQLLDLFFKKKKNLMQCNDSLRGKLDLIAADRHRWSKVVV